VGSPAPASDDPAAVLADQRLAVTEVDVVRRRAAPRELDLAYRLAGKQLRDAVQRPGVLLDSDDRRRFAQLRVAQSPEILLVQEHRARKPERRQEQREEEPGIKMQRAEPGHGPT